MTNSFPTGASLKGKRLLVTRPAHQADGCCHLIQSLGGEAIAFPLLEITPLADNDPSFHQAKAHILDLDLYDQIIFVSPNAARIGASLIDDYWPQPPVRQRIHAIGNKTADILTDYGLDAERNALGYDSESLLKSAALAEVNEQRILILRGVGGRALLADTLTARGASVSYADLYQRQAPAYNNEIKKQHLFNSLPDVILITSGEALHNMVKMAQGVQSNTNTLAVFSVPIVVPSKRIAEHACRLGFKRIITSNGPDDERMIQALFDNNDVDSDR